MKFVDSYKICRLWFIFILYFCIFHSGNVIDVKIGLFTERPIGSEDELINLTASYINEVILPKRSITFKIVNETQQTVSDVQAAIKVCGLLKAGISGLVTEVSCETSKLLNSQLSIYNIPLISITPQGCSSTRTDNPQHTLFLRSQPHYLIEGLISVINFTEWSEVTILYDDSIDKTHVVYFLEELSKKSIKVFPVYIPRIQNNSSDKGFVDLCLKTAISTLDIHNFAVLTASENARLISNVAVKLGLNDPSYYWIIVNEDLSLLTTVDGWVWRDSNLLGLHYHYPTLTSRTCSPVDARLMQLIPSDATVSEKYKVDGFLIFANAINVMSKQGNWINNPGQECYTQNVTGWKTGTDLRKTALKRPLLKGVTNDIYFDTAGYNGNVMFDISAIDNYADDNVLQETVMATWNPKAGLNLTGRFLFPDTFKDFQNVTIKIGVREEMPFSIKVINGNETYWKGFSIDIVKELAQRLNFSYEIVEAPDGQYGSPLKDGTGMWSGSIGMLMRGEVTMVAIPLTTLSERMAVVDFTPAIIVDGPGILIKTPTKRSDPEYLRVFSPLHFQVWLFVIGAILVTGFISCVIRNLNQWVVPDHGAKNLQTPENSLYQNVWHIYAMFLEQGSGGTLEAVAVSSRALAIFWSLFMVVIFATYTANLVAYLTVTIINLPITTLEDLAHSAYIMPLVKNGSSEINVLEKSEPGSVYSKISEKLSTMDLPTEPEQVMLMVDTGEYAYITDTTILDYIVAKSCGKYVTTGYTFALGGRAFAVGKNKPYTKEINYNIVKMKEAGLIDRWRTIWWRSPNPCVPPNPNQAQAMQLPAVSGIFLLVLGLSTVAVIALCVELCIFRKRRNMYLKDSK